MSTLLKKTISCGLDENELDYLGLLRGIKRENQNLKWSDIFHYKEEAAVAEAKAAETETAAAAEAEAETEAEAKNCSSWLETET